MRAFSQDFKTHIEQGCTTLCWAWKLNRKDGVVMGFTDHDGDIAVNGQIYQASSGFGTSEIEQRLGFSLDNSAVLGALSSDHITKVDIDAGLYDGAHMEIHRVNWQDTTIFAHIWSGQIGDITLRDEQFEAELVGPAALLERSTGRVFSRQCDVEFGSAKCGVDLTNYPSGTVCPHTLSACKEQFDNTANFRGFPYLIGDDASYAAPREGDAKDGHSRYKT